MPLFRCSRCDCVENTALSSYWVDQWKGRATICSECETGKWHNKFPKRSADGYYFDDTGFLFHPDEIDHTTMEWKSNPSIKMIGKYEKQNT